MAFLNKKRQWLFFEYKKVMILFNGFLYSKENFKNFISKLYKKGENKLSKV